MCARTSSKSLGNTTSTRTSISKGTMENTASPGGYVCLLLSRTPLIVFFFQQYSIDVGYERFLIPEVFFNPEIYSSDFLTPLPIVVDDTIQQSPIDVRRGLYKVCNPCMRPRNSHIWHSCEHVSIVEYCAIRWIDHV